MWVKIATAATSVVCSMCIAASASLPAENTAAGSAQMAKAVVLMQSTQPNTVQLAAASAAFNPFQALLDTAAQGFINNAINNLGGIAAFSALPFYRNILLNLPPGTGTTTPPPSTTPTDFINNAINNLGGIAAFSALPIYRNILLGLPPGSTGPTTMTASTGGTSATPGTGRTGPRWSPTNGKTFDSGSAATPGTSGPAPNEDLNGPEAGTLPNPLRSITSGGSGGGTTQQDPTPSPSDKRDAKRSTGDQETTGKSGNGSFSRKFEPSPIIFDNGGSKRGDNGMGWGGLGGLFGKGEGSSTTSEGSTSTGAPK
jgi:hypothetical protein